jgi:transposase
METRETITLDAAAQRRLYILNHVLAGELSGGEAAGLLGLSVRQFRRLMAAYRSPVGAAALVHGNRGRRPANRLDDATRERIVELASTRYAGLNRAHLADLLAEREQLDVPVRSLRRILDEAGLAKARTRRPGRHHSRRDRMSQAGLLVQVDGSRHDWLEGRGPWLTLVGAIDDATGVVTGAVFRDQEDSAGYFEVLCQTAAGHGLPLGLYSDRHGIFWRGRRLPTLAEQFSGRQPTTQVGRALQEAGIAWIAARSPQAKGRVERLWGTLQDRLVAELRLAGSSTIEAANATLASYLPRHNARFAVPPANPLPAWRTLPGDRPAETVFCFSYPRKVAGDATVTLDGQSLSLPRAADGRAWGGRTVIVQERLDGSLWVADRNTFLPLREASPLPIVLRARDGHPKRTRAAAQPRPPQGAGNVQPATRTTPRTHPWRLYPAVRPR